MAGYNGYKDSTSNGNVRNSMLTGSIQSPTSPTGWLHELARAEAHPDAEKLLNLGKAFDPQQLIEESSVDFLMEMREFFNVFARTFNGFSENGSRFQEAKVYSVAQSAADFMVFRNQVKLVVSNVAHGVIQISFAQHVRGTVAIDGQTQPSGAGTKGSPIGSTSVAQQSNGNQIFDLMAQMGPFRDVFWTFQGEKVSPEQVSKFFFGEFVRFTREARRSKVTNQVLIEQIKALLQEKGLDL